MKSTDNALPNIKPGDKVLLRYSGDGNSSVRTVSRTTGTQIIIPGVTPGTVLRFWRKDGRAVGSASSGVRWRWWWIEAATPEAITAIDRRERRHAAYSFLRHCDLSAVPLEELERITGILRDFGAVTK